MAIKDVLRPRPGVAPRLAGVWVHLVAVLVIAALVLAATSSSAAATGFLATSGSLAVLGALGVAAFIAVVAVLGAERTALVVLAGGYFTAAFYKGFAPSPGSIVTGTDALLLLGFLLLLPRIIEGRLQLPLTYYAGVAVVFVSGLVASAYSARPSESIQDLVFWMIVMLGLPITVALWGPSNRVVDVMAGSFVAGHLFSFALGAIRGNMAQDRHAGLATHPNYFAQSGMMAVVLLIFLAYRHFGKSILVTGAMVAAAGASAASVVLSGSRAATVVLAVVILVVPVVERSALIGFLVAATAALALVALPTVAGIAGTGSSLDRLAGGGGSGQSNSARTLGIDEGVDRFFEHPLRGSGLIDLFEIHNNFLEVAVAVGVFGLAGYLMVLYSFARPILGTGEHRRLAYVVVAYIGFSATVPGLYDRSIWALMALNVVAMTEFERARRSAVRPAVRTSPSPPPIGASGRSASRTGPGEAS